MKKQSKFRLSNKFRPHLESLNERINPSFTGNYVAAPGGFAFLVSSDANDDATVTLNTQESGITGVRITAVDGVSPDLNLFISDDNIKAISGALLLNGNSNNVFQGFAVKTLGGEDTIFGDDLSNYSLSVDTGDGNDQIFGSPNGDKIDSGAGNDEISGSGGADNISAGAGDDNVEAGDGNDTVSAGAGDDEVDGGAGDDSLTGGDGDDVLLGGAGKDAMHGGQGDDTIEANTADFLGADGKPIANGVVPITGGGNSDFPPVTTPPTPEDTEPDVLNITSGSSDKLTYTNDGFEEINGGSGAETINAGDGDQTVNGGGGADSLFGGDGDDELNGGDGNDTVEGGAGSDTMTGNGGTADVLSFFNSDDGVFVVMGSTNIIATGGDADGDAPTTGFEGISGSDSGDDFIAGNTNNNVLLGNGGDDTISGGGGNDDLSGGADSDELNGGSGNDKMDGGSGSDELNGGSGGDTMVGGTGSDELTGGSGNDDMDGGDGNDVVDGGLGSDFLRIDAKNFSTSERLFGSADSDIFNVVNATKNVGTSKAPIIVLDEVLVNETIGELEFMARQNPPTCDYDAAVDALDFIV